jgi:hypothetical protein
MSEYAGLALACGFGIVYNWAFVRWGYRQDLTAFWVAAGVLATLAIAATVTVPAPRLQLYWLGQPVVLSNQQHAVLYLLKFFAASGAPMTAGSLWRAWRKFGA